MQLLGMLLLGAISGSPPPAAAQMQLKARVITAGDLSASAPGRDDVVGTLASENATIRLTVDEQQRLLRNRYPSLPLPLRHHTDVIFIAGQGGDAVKTGGTCYATRHEIASGDYLDRKDVDVVACQAGVPRAAMGYDHASAAPYASADLPAFSYVGALKLPAVKPLKAGQMLTLRTIAGPVTIDRTVRALQPGRPGHRLFVETSDGEVITQRLSEDIGTGNSR